ncbi:MAG: hypothetical protein JNK63_08510 [Chthonomonas sp.]|nr:hypothetical protein [Chthonomonas sp.]
MKFIESSLAMVLAQFAYGDKPLRMISEYLPAEEEIGVHPDILAAPALSNDFPAIDQPTLRWLYPTKISDDKLLVPIRQTKPLTQQGDEWPDWFKSLNAEPPPDTPAWAQLALQKGRIFGQLNAIGDSLWITYNDEEASSIQRAGLTFTDNQLIGKMYGSIRLLPAALELSVSLISDGSPQRRSVSLPAFNAPKSAAELLWLKRLEPLRQANFWQSLKDEGRLIRLFEQDSDLEMAQTTEIRASLATDYSNWQTEFCKTLGPKSIASLSPIEALRLVESAPKVPWSLQPELRQSPTGTLLRAMNTGWRAELNVLRALSLEREPGVLSPTVRGEMAQLTAESDFVDQFVEPVMALEGLSRGFSTQRRSASTMRVLALYKGQIGRHGAQALLQNSGLLNTFMLVAASTKNSSGKAVIGSSVCALHAPSSLQLVEISRATSSKIAFIGGNERLPFTYRSSPSSPKSFGLTLAEIMWKELRIDNFALLSDLEVSVGDPAQITIDLHFPTGIASSSFVESPFKLAPVKLGSLPLAVRSEIQSAFDREVARLKKEPTTVP